LQNKINWVNTRIKNCQLVENHPAHMAENGKFLNNKLGKKLRKKKIENWKCLYLENIKVFITDLVSIDFWRHFISGMNGFIASCFI